MKNIFLLAVVLYGNMLYAQDPDTVIRSLEAAEKEAILKGDTVMLAKLMSQDIVIQNPENAIIRFPQVMERMRQGKISYRSFGRHINHIQFTGNLAIVMGWEELVPKTGPQAGKTIHRRFTNIWQEENGIWKMIARQATIFSKQ